MIKASNSNEAIVRLTKEIEQNPDNFELYFERGTAYFDLEKWDDAIADFEETVWNTRQDDMKKKVFF